MVTVEAKRYEQYGWDEDSEQETDDRTGWVVFSAIAMGHDTYVRAVVESEDGTPARPSDRVWFVEWQHENPSASCKLAKDLTRAQALEIGGRAAAQMRDMLATATWPTDGPDVARMLGDAVDSAYPSSRRLRA